MTEQITLTYRGRRIGHANKTIFEFDYGTEVLAYAGLRHGVVGGIYTVEAEIDGDNVRIRANTLTYAGEKIDDVDQVAVWEAADRDTYDTSQKLAAERKHAKSSELDAALEPALRIMARASTRAEADALISVITHKLDRAWWNR